MIKLTKKLIGKRAGGPQLLMGDKWVSNGHWMVLRELFTKADRALLRDDEVAAAHYGVITDELPRDGEGVLAKANDLLRYETTKWQRLGALYLEARVGDTRHHICVDVNYAKLLGMDVAFWARPDPESECYDDPEDPRVVLMPMRGVDALPMWAQVMEI